MKVARGMMVQALKGANCRRQMTDGDVVLKLLTAKNVRQRPCTLPR